VLKGLKQIALSASKQAGLLRWVSKTGWRHNRLLIIGYHGVSLEDEHVWRPGLYLSPEMLEARFELIRRERCAVLPLSDALRMLKAGELPERSVALTFDDGFYDFVKHARPLLSAFAFPATVYLTTYYCRKSLPIFEITCMYLLWKAQGRKLAAHWIRSDERPTFDLREAAGRAAAMGSLRRFAAEARLSGAEKGELTARLAESLGIDYGAFLEKRILQIMKPAEVADLSAQGIDFQLHTHRHRVPAEKDAFVAEIQENRRAIVEMTGKNPVHFCYPSGRYAEEFLPWLAESGVVSATTCRPGLASQSEDPLLLSRLLDSSNPAPIEFEAWVSGFAGLIPRRPGTGVPPRLPKA
jgi:peptidoglycan/xylan/chitin deacetylase (PgdA/CDA1 family)